MPFFTEPETVYTLSPGLSEQKNYFPETGSLLQAPPGGPSQQPLLSQPHGYGFHGPMVLYQPDQPRSQHNLASPSLGWEESEYLSYQSSPSSGTVPLDFHNSRVPPTTWQFSSDSFARSTNAGNHLHRLDLAKDQGKDGQMSLRDYHFNISDTTLPCQSSSPSILGSTSAGKTTQRYSPRISQDNSPPTLTLCANSPYEPHVSTPASMEQPKAESPAGNTHASPASRKASAAPKASSTKDGVKSSEPYAKLIERALLNAPNHRMQLQEIYAWFVKNTEKTTSDDRGWQNSIRHNLSMNAVSSTPLYVDG